MNDDQFFDGGWCWMSHPEYNCGDAVPVKMEAAEGGRWFYPLDPRGATEHDWDRREKLWQMIRPPMADLQDAIVRDDLLAALQGLLLAVDIDTVRQLCADEPFDAARAAIAAATGTPT